MVDYTHPDDFDLLVKTTPYKVWMWLIKETIYEIPGETYDELPTLTPPKVWEDVPQGAFEEYPEIKYIQYSFRSPEKAQKPHPFDSNAQFVLGVFYRYYKEKEKEDEIPIAITRTQGEVIRIFLNSDEEGLTQVIGEYITDWSELVEYMKQLRDALVEKFPEVGGEDHTQGKIKKGETRIQKKDAGRPRDTLYDEAYNRLLEGEDVTSVFDWWCEKENVDTQNRKQFTLDRKRFKKAMKYREKTQN